MDPQIARLLADASAADPRGIESLGINEARIRGGSVAVAAVPFEDVAEVRDIAISGEPMIPARLYRPSTGTLPLLVYFHGGGWVVGSVALSDNYCRALANASGCAILSVEYRLAPEHRYPAAAEDAYAATRWASEHAADLGIDSARVAVGGSSAGGNLAAAVTLMARERGGPEIALQLLHVPVLDHDLTRASYDNYASGVGLTRAGMKWFWDNYAPDIARRDEPFASPLRAADLRGLPPAIFVIAECDPLRDEGAAYAERLKQARVQVTYLEYAGMVHAFMGWSSVVETGARAFKEVGAELRRALS
ncbi:MAG TPA: alpha/beta hydrolase [Candidatus Limnocylindrales bacterium]|nr:alpha/beta hydrolase [Candidatus Limnocylindrales bacterium]